MPYVFGGAPQIPFYDTYRQRTAQNDAAGMNELQKFGAVQQVFGQLRAQEDEQALRGALAESNGDPEKALAAALKLGNVSVAAKLEPLAKLQQQKREGEETRAGLAQLYGGGGAASVGQSGPAAAPTPAAPSAPDRIEQLQRLAVLYAKNPQVVKSIQSEIERVQRDSEKVPQKRERVEGDTLVQEQYNPKTGKYEEYGRGPRFASQLAPVKERLLPVKDASGNVIYLPESEARGKQVGGRTTDVNLPKQVQQLGRDIEKAELPQSIAVLRRAEAITPETASYITGPKSNIPDPLVSPDIRAARQDVQRLFNITLKQRSGAAVTNQEMDRLKEEFGKGQIKKPDQLITAIGRMREILENHYTSIAGSYGKDALDAYNANIEAVGGSPFETRQKGKGGAPAQPAAPQPQSGALSPAEQTELERLRKKYGRR